MADGTVNVEESASPTKQLDTTSLTVGANTVQRERIQLAGAAAAELAAVDDATPGATVYGLVVRLIAEAIGNALFVKLTDGTDVVLVSAAGALHVDGSAVTQPVSGPLTDAELRATAVPVSLATVPSHAVTNAGTFAVQVSTAIPAGDNNIGNVDVASSALPTGAATEATLLTIDADTGGILTAVQILDNAISGSEMQVDVVAPLPAGTAAIGNVGIVPRTSGGASIFRSIDLDESEEEVKGTAGQVFGWFMSNLATGTRVIKFYNETAANVTVGTTTPVLTIPLEADQAANVSFPFGIAFGTAITVAATTGIADNDTGVPGANEVIVNVFYA